MAAEEVDEGRGSGTAGQDVGIGLGMKTSKNVLALYLSGIDPPSRRRRFKYLLRFWLPFVCFVTVWVGIAVLLPVGKELRVLVLVFTIAAMGIGQIGLRIIFGGDTHQFRSNWQDYRLAGILSRDILWSFSQPAFKSGVWLTTLALALFTGFIVPDIATWIDNGQNLVTLSALLCVIVDAGFLLTGGVLLDTTVWDRASGIGARIISAATLLLCSGAIVCLAIILLQSFLKISLVDHNTLVLLLPMVIVTLGFRIWYVRVAWKRAVQRLDGQLD